MTEEELLIVHRYKTGAMIAGACEIGAAAAGADKDIRDAASEYGFNLGLAFQIRDDVLDVVSSSEELGKPQGSDKDQGKVTFTDLFGLEECRQKVITYTDRAVESVAFMDRDDFLKDLAYSLIERRS
mgnify:CR=1 FL=1